MEERIIDQKPCNMKNKKKWNRKRKRKGGNDEIRKNHVFNENQKLSTRYLILKVLITSRRSFSFLFLAFFFFWENGKESKP